MAWLHANSATDRESLEARISFCLNFCFSAFFRWPVFFFGIVKVTNQATNKVKKLLWNEKACINPRVCATAGTGAKATPFL